MFNCRYFLVIVCLALTACTQQQNPAQVVKAVPSTYKVLADRSSKESLVKSKMLQKKEDPHWLWPVNGPVLSKFAPGRLKGIDIAGKEGMLIIAAADGEVVYSGNSLQGYGNLIIIRHKKNFLTAYAHNRKNMVQEGDRVVAGQSIAEMGSTGTNRVKLHFEMRHHGSPIDPQKILPKK